MTRVLKIDASVLAQSDCLRRFNFIAGEGYKHRGAKPSLNFGSGFHKGVEVWYATKGDVEYAIKSALEVYPVAANPLDWRTPERLKEDLRNYFKVYTPDTFKAEFVGGEALVEKQFAFPLFKDGDIEVVLCGTIDRVGEYQGSRVIVDTKTTKASHTKSWDLFKSYSMKIQMQTYSYAWHYLTGGRELLPVMMDFVFLSPPTVKPKPGGNTVFKRSPLILMTEEKLLEYESFLHRRVKQLVEAFKEFGSTPPEEWPLNFNCCSGVFGEPCVFFDVCNSPKEARRHILEGDFIKRPFDPLNYAKENKEALAVQ